MKAMELIVAPRIPERPKNRTGDIFASEGDVVADCAVEGCSWHVFGARADVKLAIGSHNRMYHSDEIGTVLLNRPRQ